jgi:hypothetical protein
MGRDLTAYPLPTMTDRAEGLYGVKQASKTKTKDISSSTSLAFSSSLASLISNSSKSNAPTARPRSNKAKSDIFTAHNKNVKKRSAADSIEDGEQRHKTAADLGTVDSATIHHSKRRMEEKARLYAAMKRGDYVASANGRDERGLVDFDRKWAEREARGGAGESDDTSSGSEDEASDDGQELVEYEDEFGRRRKGTKAAAAREERRRRIQANAAAEEEDFSARPNMPTNIIYGDTVQHNAFNPDEMIAERMANIAKKRDRSATPPPERHYDAHAEVRTKGTGFYGFSKDAEGRKKEMEALERERLETERARKERDARKEIRRKELEERKKLIAEQRGKVQADKFLSGFQLPGEEESLGDNTG